MILRTPTIGSRRSCITVTSAGPMGAKGLSKCINTSSFSTRPCFPDPEILDRSRSFWRANLRTAGVVSTLELSRGSLAIGCCLTSSGLRSGFVFSFAGSDVCISSISMA